VYVKLPKAEQAIAVSVELVEDKFSLLAGNMSGD
jgi:hypothetical protein